MVRKKDLAREMGFSKFITLRRHIQNDEHSNVVRRILAIRNNGVFDNRHNQLLSNKVAQIIRDYFEQ